MGETQATVHLLVGRGKRFLLKNKWGGGVLGNTEVYSYILEGLVGHLTVIILLGID